MADILLLLYHRLGIRLEGCLCLTTPTDPKQKPASVFKLLEKHCSFSRIKRDRGVSHWEEVAGSGCMSVEQIRAASLDAFAPSLLAVVLGIGQPAPRVMSSMEARVPSWLLQLLSNTLSVGRQLQAQRQGKVQHDFHSATPGKSNQLQIAQARFPTRIRKGTGFIEITDCQGISRRAKVASAKGKQLVLTTDTRMPHGHSVKSIHFRDDQAAADEEALSALWFKILTGEAAGMKDRPTLLSMCGRPIPLQTGISARLYSDVKQRLRQGGPRGLLNERQQEAVFSVLAPAAPVQIVRGPPGTGKTKVISEAAVLWSEFNALGLEAPAVRGKPPLMICCARSNVAALNIAVALSKCSEIKRNFKLVVSHEYHFEWHDDRYGDVQDQLIVSNELKDDTGRHLSQHISVLVCTLSMLSSKKIKQNFLSSFTVLRLLVDEASQVYVGDYLSPINDLPTLRGITFFGDDKQLPPFGSDQGPPVSSVFEIQDIWKRQQEQQQQQQVRGRAQPQQASESSIPAVMLSISYRLPGPVCTFVSQNIYNRELKSGKQPHHQPLLRDVVLWYDVEGKEELKGHSTFNPIEAGVAVNLAKVMQRDGQSNWKILTGYDAHRHELEQQLLRSLQADTAKDRVFNADTFQGREEDIIILSLARTSSPGFMRSDRRVNVMLTRCKEMLIIVGSLRMAKKNSNMLIGKMATYCIERGLVVHVPRQ